MILYFHQKLRELQMSAHEFFQLAYQWKFNKIMDLHDDFSQYLLHSVIPLYAREFIKHLQENERARNLVHQVPESGERAFDSAFHLNIGDEEGCDPRRMLGESRVSTQGEKS